jgi:Cytochrome c oxidase subunit IV
VRTVFRLMLFVGLFGVAVGTVYWFVSYEDAGTVLLGAIGVMGVVVACWLALAGARGAGGPDDDPDATPASAAGEPVGSFPAASVWPIFLALAAIVIGAGLVYGTILLPVGIGLFGYAIVGLMRESRG